MSGLSPRDIGRKYPDISGQADEKPIASKAVPKHGDSFISRRGKRATPKLREETLAHMLSSTKGLYAKKLGIESSEFKSTNMRDLNLEYEGFVYQQEIEKVSSEQEAEARAKAEKKLAGRRRRAKTILTSPLGLKGGSVQQTVLGGQ